MIVNNVSHRILWEIAEAAATARRVELIRAGLAAQPTHTWEPTFSPWRHGGWYVDNLSYPSGAVGCVSRNYADRRWRIACDDRPGSFPGGPNDHTYPNRVAAARAERELIAEAVLAVGAMEVIR